MNCRYSYAPHGRTGDTALFCSACQLIVKIVPSVAEAKILAQQWSEVPPICQLEQP